MLRAGEVLPSPAQWRTFLEQVTLWLGAIALAAAVIFFFAFNWNDLSRFAKFGLVEAAILATLLVAWRVRLDDALGQAILVVLSLLTGALLALAGQVYQTGADTYELFAWWAVLILPWVLAGRFSPLWLVWLTLLNLAAFFYVSLGWAMANWFWALFALNGIALVLWEGAHRVGLSWVRDSWPPRLVSIAAGAGATGLAISAILSTGDTVAMRITAAITYAAWLAVLYHWYRNVRSDPFMLAGGVLSLIVAVAVFLSYHMLDLGSAAFLLIGLVVIGMSAGGAVWLRSVVGEQTA